MDEKPSLKDAAAMLALLREAPGRRVVRAEEDIPWVFARVLDYPEDKTEGGAEVVAWIADEGTAKDLLDQAWEVDVALDLAVWSALPIRYGPDCSMWVLPEHPKAPQQPGPPD